MSVASYIRESMEKSSLIRKMFEEGARLKKQFGEDNVFDFSLGNPDLPPPVDFFNAINDICLASGKSMLNEHGYMQNAGFTEVRNTIARKISQEHKISTTGDQIVMTCGAAGGLNVVFKTILNPGEEIIVPRPFFPEYNFYAANHNGKVIGVNSNMDFSINIDNIISAINDKTKAILINSPNNPSGKVYSEEDIRNISDCLNDQLKKHSRHIFLISDEPYRELVYNDNTIPSIFKYYHNSILVYSYSKTLSIAGERIGYIAVNPAADHVDTIIGGLILSTRILGYVNAPALMQKVITKISDVTVNTELYKKRRDMFYDNLTEIGFKIRKPEGAFYLFPETPIPDDLEFVKHLQKYNILVVPGSGFECPGFFRISYAVPEKLIINSKAKFKEAFDSVK